MAKYTVTMSCGHTETIEMFGKTSERERKIAYYEASGLCKECYIKKQKARQEAQGLIFNASPTPNIDVDDGSILINVWFEGNSKPYKDDIKSLGGYYWYVREAADDIIGLKRPPMCWTKTIKLSELGDEIAKAKSIGANSIVKDTGLFAMVDYQIALKKQKDWIDKQDKIKAIKKPEVPELLKGCKRWNKIIYGKSGGYSIYPDGVKVDITDEQAKELKDYLIQKEQYKKDVAEITNH